MTTTGMTGSTPAARDPAAQARALIEDVLRMVGHGFLGLTGADGWPRAVPLNFVHLDGRVYLHGSATGEKMAAIARDPRVSFTVVAAGALIPSYLRHPRSACPATQYFRSVYLLGRARRVDCAAEKARALQALMEKLQPEGGHEPITPAAELYRGALGATAVVAIDVERMTGKLKLGQNLTPRVRAAVVRGLRRRGTPLDLETVRWMSAGADLPVLIEVDSTGPEP